MKLWLYKKASALNPAIRVRNWKMNKEANKAIDVFEKNIPS